MYQQMIRETLANQGRIGVKPHQVEAWMRLEFGTLDALGGAAWNRAVREAVDCIDGCPESQSERLAQSYGLKAVQS